MPYTNKDVDQPTHLVDYSLKSTETEYMQLLYRKFETLASSCS